MKKLLSPSQNKEKQWRYLSNRIFDQKLFRSNSEAKKNKKEKEIKRKGGKEKKIRRKEKEKK